MPVGNEKVAIIILLHANIIAHSPKIISQVKVSCGTYSTNYNFLCHSGGENSEFRLFEVRRKATTEDKENTESGTEDLREILRVLRVTVVAFLRTSNFELRTHYICTMQVDDALVDKLARLSMLQFSEEEKEEIKSDLQKMIGFMDKIRELDLNDVDPLLHICHNQDVLREDIPGKMLTREEALKNSGGQDGQYFIVPKTINKSGQ